MKKYIWAKTLLTIYPYLETMANAIDKQVELHAKNSFYVTCSNFLSNSTTVVADNIINLSERKITLINIKVLIEKALNNCGEALAQILIRKFFDKEKAKEIADDCNLTMRTYFRKLNDGFITFSKSLIKLGFDDNKISNLVKNEDWIILVFNQFEEGDDEVSLSSKLIRRIGLG